jgi:hypothetical protein
MIFEVLQKLSVQLNDYLKIRFRLTEDIVFISPVKDPSKSFPNRVAISLIGVERETVISTYTPVRAVSDTTFGSVNPPIWINLNVLISVIFHEKQYEESIQLLSGVMSFIQRNTLLQIGDESKKITLEIINLNMYEISNLWSNAGESYFPSVICKIRGTEVTGNEIYDISYTISKPESNTDLK